MRTRGGGAMSGDVPAVACAPGSRGHVVTSLSLWLINTALIVAAFTCVAPGAFGQAPPPTVSSVYPFDPYSGYQGENLPTVIIYGSNFQNGATCSFGAGITVNSCTFNSPTQLNASLTISPTAPTG